MRFPPSRFEVRDQRGRLVTASVELRYRRITVLPPIGKQKRYRPLSVTVLHAREPETPKDHPAIDWQLITDLLVDSPKQAVEKSGWYARRWKIEVFHHILKTGCRAEHARLGGYLARSRDPPPGNLVMWRGFARLADIALGAALAQTSPGCG